MWKRIIAICSFLALLFFGLFSERNKRKTAEAKLVEADHDKDSAVLKEKLAQLDKEKKAALAVAEVEKGRKLSKEELLDFLKDL